MSGLGMIYIAEESDQPRVEALMQASFKEHVTSLGYAPSPMRRDFRPWLKERFVLGVDDEAGEMIGAAALRPRLVGDNGYFYVDALAVAPTHRRRGVGAQLMRSIHRLAAELCFDRVRLHTSPMLPGPMRFYRRLGFVELRRDGREMDERVLMETLVDSALGQLLSLGR